MQGSLIGVGPALRKARLIRGLSLEEASRETRIRPELLEALEGELFDSLSGDVYVRGALRSYATYLGLNPNKVVSAYARGRNAPPTAPRSPRPPAHAEAPAISGNEHHRARRIAVVVAGALLLMGVAFGLLSRSGSAPDTAPTPADVPVELTGEEITAAMVAKREVEVEIIADGARIFRGKMLEEEARSFDAIRTLTVRLSRGGVVQLTVNGEEMGRPGKPSEPYQRTFSFEERGEARSTPNG